MFDTRAAMLCQIEHIPLHLGSFIGIITEIVKRRPVEKLRPGDVLIGNDAYAGGGTHLPDIVLGEPIFVDGRLVAWAVNPRTTRISSIAGTLSITKGCASRRSGSIVPASYGNMCKS